MNHVNIHALFVQLQTRYPTSSLTTELVQIHEGLFVVRALVQLGGTAIASSMAASASVELAEDQARIRALSVLGITPTSIEMPQQPITSPSNGFSTSNQFNSGVSSAAWDSEPSQFTASSLDSPVLDLDAPVSNMTSLLPEPLLPSVLTPPEPTIDSSFNSSPDVFEYDRLNLDEPLASETDEPVERPSSTTSKPQRKTKTEAAIAPPVEEPDDLSTLIAHTDVEMDRVGWSKQDGRDYLKRTYSKSTRQRLDADELMDFLNYLRALPSANGL